MNSDLHDLKMLLNSRVRLITVDSAEEARIVEIFLELGATLDRPIFTWTVTDGLHRRDSEFGPQMHTRRPIDAIGQIRATPRAGVYLMLDFGPYFDDVINRHLKELCQAADGPDHTLVMVGENVELPASLRALSAAFSAL